MTVGIHHFEPSVRYVTCLRSPVSRIVSHYHHAKNTPDHYLHTPIHERDMTLADYVRSGLSRELSNGMTRLLGEVPYEIETVGEDALVRAKETIARRFDAVLLTEQFDAGLLLLAEKLQMATPYYVRRKVGRENRDRVALSDEDRSVVEEENQLDLQLYEWVRERFESEMSSHPNLNMRVEAFQKRNPNSGRAVYAAREIRRQFSKCGV
jgi:hypothetical protein